ncbi:MAG: hypothetical protein QG574_5091 [Cyanobacteriota bacterium erpe_2018_sw_21hr_WHONDRS-SW48-000092_B_bin.40]|jgi:hypothetical protein|nr:hypothetical protein [Cyanobacteriota bacterium erpe_2018_sw_21hr_WHONDRS-SW48-000092_B_bin.40]
MNQMFQMFLMQMQHLWKMFFYFLAAAAVTTVFGLGVSAGDVLPTALAAVLVSAGALIGGVGLTIGMRALFGLMQVGRLLQYTAFWLSAALSLKIIGIIGGLLFAASLTVNSALLAGFTVFAIAFAAATITGEVPTKGRTWLPMKMKSPPKK